MGTDDGAVSIGWDNAVAAVFGVYLGHKELILSHYLLGFRLDILSLRIFPKHNALPM